MFKNITFFINVKLLLPKTHWSYASCLLSCIDFIITKQIILFCQVLQYTFLKSSLTGFWFACNNPRGSSKYQKQTSCNGTEHNYAEGGFSCPGVLACLHMNLVCLLIWSPVSWTFLSNFNSGLGVFCICRILMVAVQWAIYTIAITKHIEW